MSPARGAPPAHPATREPLPPSGDTLNFSVFSGSIVTFVAELASPDLPQLRLWEPEAYKDTVNAFTLYRGIVLGITDGSTIAPISPEFEQLGQAYLPPAFGVAVALLAAGRGLRQRLGL